MFKPFLYALIGIVVVIIVAAAISHTTPQDSMMHESMKMESPMATGSQMSHMPNTMLATHAPGEMSDMMATPATVASVTWQQTSDGWRSTGNSPACSSPINLSVPTDLSKVTSILYPGQTRGGNYKPHGGFIFKGAKNDDISVTAPLDALVTRGARYIEAGETQYLFDFIAPCGIMYRFDHLRTLTSAFQSITDTFPQPTESSETHNLTTPVSVKAGDLIATSVGFIKNNNVSFDWGVYDLRQKNKASQSAAWASDPAHSFDLASYGVCWLDWLAPADVTKVKSLPAGDAVNGKKSDYCK